jgi:hypothetical protein
MAPYLPKMSYISSGVMLKGKFLKQAGKTRARGAAHGLALQELAAGGSTHLT